MRLFFLAVVMFFFTASASAETSLTTDCTVWSKYHGADGSVYDPDLSLQCNATVSNDGWYGGVWVAEDFDNNADFGNEVDFHVGKSGQISLFSYDVGAQYFVLHQPTLDSGDVANVYLKLSLPEVANVWGVRLSPYAKLDYYTPIGDAPASGTFYRAGIVGETSLTNGWTLSIDRQLTYDDGAFGADSGWLAFTNLSLGYAVNETVTVAGLLKHSIPLGDDSFRESEVSFGFSLTKTW